MPKILILFHSWTGNVHRLAEGVAAGAREIDGCEVALKQVPEVVPEDALDRAGATEPRKAFAHIPVATIEELPDYHGFAFGTPTRFGSMSSTMRSFLDQTGGYYAQGTLTGRVGTVFCGTGTGGGMETTIYTSWTTLAHHGMLILPLGYRAQEVRDVSAASGGGPYGAAVLARGPGDRPTEMELAPARMQGRGLAETTLKLFGEENS
ncbi:MAG: NAD(P)H:quinone oxidoreductase [Pseudomonadota bacterium]|nr:NAD(P)H:quinone oxidoreductase [Pseudomonadota bacterium]